MKIKWKYVTKQGNIDDIKRIEEYFKVKLPDDYKECVLKNNGGSPFPNVFNTKNTNGEMINNLLSLDINDSEGDPIRYYNDIKGRLPGKIIPFAEDAGGNMICFDYRNCTQNPKVVFWEHEAAYRDKEKGIIPVCDTFTQLLESLYEPED